MFSSEDLDWLKDALQQTDDVLRGMADFREFPEVLQHSDPQVERLLDRVITGVRDARALNARVLSRVEDAAAEVQEAVRAAAVAAKNLEAAPEAPSPLPVVRPPINQKQIYMANPTGMREAVLVTDHDLGTLAGIEKMLTDEDYRVLSVRDAFEAVSIYARLWAAIDLVVLDFSMPGMDGDLLFAELQAINPKVAAVVTGGFTEPAKLNQMLAQGLKGFLPKPFEKEKFLRQIRQVLSFRAPTPVGAGKK